MKELTREEIEAIANKDGIVGMDRGLYITGTGMTIYTDIATVAKQLLLEMDKPSVWTDAPAQAVSANVIWTDLNGINLYGTKVYKRELPKSRERQIAEELSGDTETCHPMINGVRAVDVIEQALLKYKAELEAGR